MKTVLPTLKSPRRLALLALLALVWAWLAAAPALAAPATGKLEDNPILRNTEAVGYGRASLFASTSQCSGALVYLSPGGYNGLVLSAEHGKIGRGDFFLFAKASDGVREARVDSVVASSKPLDYRLLRVHFDRPAKIRPVELDVQLPAGEPAYSVGYHGSKLELRGAEQVTKAGRAVRLKMTNHWLTPRRTVVEFKVPTLPGESGGPVFDGRTHKATGIISCRSLESSSTFFVPTVKILVDVAKRYKSRRAPWRSWLRTARGRADQKMLETWLTSTAKRTK